MRGSGNIEVPIRCSEEAAQWSLRVEDTPSPADARDFNAWLEFDPANRMAFDSLAALMGDVEHFAGAPEIVSLRSQALATARRSHEVLRARAFFASRIGKAASIAFLAVILGAAGYWWFGAVRTLATDIGERRMVAMADGSHLSLDAATEVSVNYTDQRRRFVLRRGRAKFDVARDSLRPFTVEADGRVVVATGTSFSIELLRGQTRVALYEGRVEIMPPTGAASDRIVLEPGYELIFEPHRAPQLAALDVQRSLAWESGDLAFADEPLSFVVERVNRYSKPGVRVGDADAARVRISGIFHAGDTAAFVDGITRLFPIRAERNASATVLNFDRAQETR